MYCDIGKVKVVLSQYILLQPAAAAATQVVKRSIAYKKTATVPLNILLSMKVQTHTKQHIESTL